MRQPASCSGRARTSASRRAPRLLQSVGGTPLLELRVSLPKSASGAHFCSLCVLFFFMDWRGESRCEPSPSGVWTRGRRPQASLEHRRVLAVTPLRRRLSCQPLVAPHQYTRGWDKRLIPCLCLPALRIKC